MSAFGQTTPASDPQKAAAGFDSGLAAGRLVYEQQCVACHGPKGDGNGPAAVWLYPKPRNFSSGLFKIQSTPPGTLPTDQDLFDSISRGLPGSAMPSFVYLSELLRHEAVQYVKYLTAYEDENGRRINRFEQAAASGQVGKPVEVPPEPPVSLSLLVSGKEMFQKMQCFNCHGETGAGDGPQVPTLKDALGFPIRPRDFNTGAFRGGSRGRDLYLRIHNGLAGTPMAPYGPELLTPEQRWALVHYVQSLRRTEVAVNDILAPENGVIRAQRVKKLPTEPMDLFWGSIDPVRVPLNPLWPEPNPLYAVAVTAVHDGRQLAILCQWRDTRPSGAAVRVQDFQDAIAVQFSLNGAPPFLGMGDAGHPVNIWQWKAGWQQEVEGHRPDLVDLYPSLHVDTYFATSYLTAQAAGNLFDQPHKSPIEDANARGFGTLKSQPVAQQNVRGKGTWHDGFWNVVFIRNLRSSDAEDVKLRPGRQAPVAFAVWNGQQTDRNGRKVISNWYQLVLER